jgi:hypothetical protein
MARNRIIALALAAIVSLTAIGAMLVRSGDGSTPPESAAAHASPGSTEAPATTSTTGVADSPVAAEESLPPTTEAASQDVAAPTAPTEVPNVPAAPVHEVLPGAGSPPPANPTDPSDPIGDLDDDRPVPAGFDFTAPPKKPGAPVFGGPTGLAVEPSCSVQCIKKGVAYPRGFGAELVVETTVPAQLLITAIADLDDNGTYEDVHADSTGFLVTSRTWDLDHLEPGQTYYVMAAATDEHQHTAYVWGEFTTLSHRTVFVEFGNGEIVGGPGNIDATHWLLGLDGPLTDVTPGQQGILLYNDLPRHVDVDFWVTRSWDEDICEVWNPEGAAPQGHDASGCIAWNSTSLDGVDLDGIPAGQGHWTDTTVSLTLHPPTGEGGALPPGYGDPYYFSFEVPVTFYVSYS